MRNEDKEQRFVMDAGSIAGIEDDCYVVTRNELIGAVRVPGIDIFHFKESDRNISMRAFGNAVAQTDIPTKYVFIGCKPDYSRQIALLARKELAQENSFRKKLLARQRAWLEYYEKNLEERLSFVLFFSPDKSRIADSMARYISCLQQAKVAASVCDRRDLTQLFSTLLQGGND